MAMPWLRLYHEFATDPKIQMLSEKDQRRYIMLLCLRCCNDDVTLQDEEVTFQLRISIDEWLKTKDVLMSKGLITADSQPTAWDKRQYKSDSSAARVARHRAKKAQMKRPCNVTETKCNAIDTDTNANSEAKNKKNAPEGQSNEVGSKSEVRISPHPEICPACNQWWGDGESCKNCGNVIPF